MAAGAQATALAEQALDTSLGTSGGTFLAAPPRTGKSTFVRQDLVPGFERRKLYVIYVDLWIDKRVNPAIHIANAIRTELAREDELNLSKDAMLASLAAKGVRDSKTDFHNMVASLPPLQSTLLREENFLWRSQRGSYSVEDEQFLEWLAEEDRDLSRIQ